MRTSITIAGANEAGERVQAEGRATPAGRPRWARWGDGLVALPARLRSSWSRSLFPGPGTAAEGGRFWGPLLLLALVAGALLFPRLAYPLVEPDEARYAELGREMLASGDWLVPRLNGEPYNDKPPLLYWLVAACLGLCGPHAWAARLVPATAAFLTVLATFAFGRRFAGSRAAFLGALALTLMAGFLHCGRFLVIDGLLTLLVSLSLLTGHEAVRGGRLRAGWWVASAVCCGLGMLAKGPVALALVGPPLAAHAWLCRHETARLRLRHWLAYGTVAGCVAAPWYVAVTLYDPAFIPDFFIEHHFSRFFRNDYHPQPFWFYVPVLLGGCLPWSLLLWPLGRFLCSRAPEVRALRRPGMGFCLLWAGWGLLFFSLSHGKLPTYLLPAIPAVALLLGCYLDAALFRGAPEWLTRTARGWAPCAVAAVLGCGWLGGSLWAWRSGLLGIGEAVGVGLGLALCAGCVAVLAVWRRRLSAGAAWALCAALSFVGLAASAQGLVPAWAARRSPVARWDELARLVDDRTGVICVGSEGAGVAFQLRGEGGWSGDLRRLGEDMPAFLRRHARTVLFVNDDIDPGRPRRILPRGLAITRTVHSGRALVFVVEPVGPAQ
jgi:4-amino-4-deoxy-L-arabinose transferase-like glycosyltransferase